MKLHKIYLHDDSMATFLCPSCEVVKDFNINDYQDVSQAVQLDYKCNCGKVYTIRIERRRFYRKDVILDGFFSWGDEKQKYPMIVKDISRTGMKIEIKNDRTVMAGDRLFVDFLLDNEQRMRIRREVIVRSISGNFLGTEFSSRDPNNPFDKVFDMAIGNYTFRR